MNIELYITLYNMYIIVYIHQKEKILGIIWRLVRNIAEKGFCYRTPALQAEW